jgi:hypothetical protein
MVTKFHHTPWENSQIDDSLFEIISLIPAVSAHPIDKPIPILQQIKTKILIYKSIDPWITLDSLRNLLQKVITKSTINRRLNPNKCTSDKRYNTDNSFIPDYKMNPKANRTRRSHKLRQRLNGQRVIWIGTPWVRPKTMKRESVRWNFQAICFYYENPGTTFPRNRL